MSEGLIISGVGIATIFVTLTVMMLLMRGMERVFRQDEVSVEEMEATGGIKREPDIEPENSAEVAAITLALVSYMKEQGRELRGRPFSIGGRQYQVELGDLSRSPVAVVVNGESYWASVGGEGLPVAEQVVPVLGTEVREAQRGQGWRSAYPPDQGGFWERRGWSGRI